MIFTIGQQLFVGVSAVAHLELVACRIEFDVADEDVWSSAEWMVTVTRHGVGIHTHITARA